MADHHTHDMKPFDVAGRQAKVYKCSSCSFKCTVGALAKVKANPQFHRIVKPKSPQAKEIYNG